MALVDISKIPTFCITPELDDSGSFKEYYKLPVVAWVIQKCSRSNGGYFITADAITTTCDPDGIDSMSNIEYADSVIAVIPARPGTFEIWGVPNPENSKLKTDQVVGYLHPEK